MSYRTVLVPSAWLWEPEVAPLKTRRDYILKGRCGQPDEVVWITRAVPITVGVKGSAEFPERTEIWYAFRRADERSAGLLAHPTSFAPIAGA